jgi:CheY-like chemotaxis protein
MNYSIMLIEDTIDLAEAISDMLRMEGFNVTKFSNGEKALYELTRNKYDLIITDLKMPGMNGVEFLMHVRKSEKLRQLPIIVLSAQTSSESKKECKEAGANLFISKPFDEEGFIFSINELIK